MLEKPSAYKIAIGFFIFWLCINLLIADFPPPIGFVWIILLLLIAAFLVFIRVPTYKKWYSNRKKGSLLRVVLDGFIVGIIFALVIILHPGSGEPSIPPPDLSENLIWFTVLGICGSINAGLVYAVVFLTQKKTTA